VFALIYHIWCYNIDMAKGKRRVELSKRETEKLLLDFCIALSTIKKPAEAVCFVQDILSSTEARMLAKRLKIAELLLDGWSYGLIAKEIKVSSSTIAKINEWLETSGDGYRILISRLKSVRKISQSAEDRVDESRSLKRRYPMYYWPQILLESIVEGASKRQQEKIRNALEQMEKKNELFHRIDTLLRKSSRM